MKKVNLPKTVDSDNGKSTGQVVGNLWEKHGMSRLYVEIRFDRGSNCKCGYVDLLTGDIKFTSRGVDGKWAEKVRAKMTIS